MKIERTRYDLVQVGQTDAVATCCVGTYRRFSLETHWNAKPWAIQRPEYVVNCQTCGDDLVYVDVDWNAPDPWKQKGRG